MLVSEFKKIKNYMHSNFLKVLLQISCSYSDKNFYYTKLMINFY